MSDSMGDAVSYLLDSHALLWWWFDPARLSEPVRTLLVDPASTVLVSAASVWELSLKHHQGKLPPADTANPTGIPLIACWLPRPNWTVWCCSPPIPNCPASLAKPSGEAPSAMALLALAGQPQDFAHLLDGWVDGHFHGLVAPEPQSLLRTTMS